MGGDSGLWPVWIQATHAFPCSAKRPLIMTSPELHRASSPNPMSITLAGGNVPVNRGGPLSFGRGCPASGQLSNENAQKFAVHMPSCFGQKMPQFAFSACSGSEHHAATLMSCFAALPSTVAAEFRVIRWRPCLRRTT